MKTPCHTCERTITFWSDVSYDTDNQYACFTLCCRPARHWANLGDYENVDDYIPMCVSCHKRMDMARTKAAR